jgi:hypothetical protein
LTLSGNALGALLRKPPVASIVVVAFGETTLGP